MEALSFDNILGEQDIENLFMDQEEPSTSEEVEEPDNQKKESEEGDIEDNDTDKTTEVDPELLFEEEEQPESVGSGKEKEAKEMGDTVPDKDSGTSPNENFYSSIANALAVDGILPNLSEEAIKKVVNAETLSEAIESEITARYDEGQQRVLSALKNGVEPSDIRKYENTLNYLSNVSEAQLSEEGEKGEELRRRIIYQDFLNKGYSQEKAQKFTERTIDAGTDVEDAKEALQSNKEFFQEEYNNLLKNAQKEADAEREERKKESEKLKESILKDKTLMGDTEINQDVRKKIFENISRPVYRDPDTGEYMTAIQKYEAEHHADFIKYVSLFYTLTDGFKDFKSFAKAEVKKEMKKGLRELEQTLNNTRRSSDGSLKMVTGAVEDPDSYLGKGFKFDL